MRGDRLMPSAHDVYRLFKVGLFPGSASRTGLLGKPFSTNVENGKKNENKNRRVSAIQTLKKT